MASRRHRQAWSPERDLRCHALAQLAVSTLVLVLLVGILLAGATAALTLAFGAGARDVRLL